MSSIINLLELGLDGASRRQQILSNNIANVNTPGYKRKEVDFFEILENKTEEKSRERLKTTSSKHFTGSKNVDNSKDFSITTERGTSYKNDENNIDIDVEMAEIAKNNIYYNTLSNQINDRFSRLKNVTEKGGK
ncbi:MAG: flagellar basal body rod protein FlgB [Halanaerobiales bacterium]